MNKKSSCGAPFGALYNSVAELFDSMMDYLYQCCVERFEILCRVDFSVVSCMSPVELVQNGLCDPVCLFVKGELHKLKKIQEEMWRLIIPQGKIDEIICRHMFLEMDSNEISVHSMIPSKPGMGFESCDIVDNWMYFSEHQGEKCDTDMSAWDWTVDEIDLAIEAEQRIVLLGAQGVQANCIRNWFYCLSHSVYCFSDGMLVVAPLFGVMKSGTKVTSSANSRIRKSNSVVVQTLLELFSNGYFAMVNGDDAVELYDPRLADTYLQLGKVLKTVNRCSDCFEFCSYRWTCDRCEPVNIFKSFGHLLLQKDASRYIYQFIYLMRFHVGGDNSPSLMSLLCLLSEFGVLNSDEFVSAKLYWEWLCSQ